MKITVKLFARFRELVGAGKLMYDVDDGTTVTGLVQNLQAEFPKLATVTSQLIVSLNQEFVDVEMETKLADGDEIALFPPVSGGSGSMDDKKFAISSEPITLDEVAGKVVKPETGAVVVFGGVVRNLSAGRKVNYLEYEAYEEMAVSKLRQVATEARRKWPDIVDIAITQRVGRLEIGENAVIVAVSSPHRGDGCFEACLYAIDRLKEIVPVWKKETGPDGVEWIEGDYLPSNTDSKHGVV